jgi:hypothetical protein
MDFYIPGRGELSGVGINRTGDAVSEPAVFVSYSRSQIPLVEDLIAALDRKRIPTAVDFRDLEPGAEWDQQLDQAIDSSKLVLLVVSERSVWTSENTRKEWVRALEQDKRVVLAIAETVALPTELADKEWIDLRRGRFGKRVSELATLIEHPRESNQPPPMSRLGAPAVVWLGTALATMAALLSVPLIWTVAIPLLLAPLPCRILQRNFAYRTVRLALAGEGVIVFLFFSNSALQALFLIPLTTFLVLRSRSFGRWMIPCAARLHLPRLPRLDRAQHPERQRYVVNSVPQDERYVREVDRVLGRYGHTKVHPSSADSVAPDVMLRFVSKFNDITDLQPGVPALPILISTPDCELPVHLQRTQWIDLRQAGPWRRRRMLKHLAVQIDRPQRLLRELGIVPSYGTGTLPRAIQALHDVIWTCFLIALISVIVEMVHPSRRPSALIVSSACIIAFLVLALRVIPALIERHRRHCHLYLLAMSILLALCTSNANSWIGNGSSGLSFVGGAAIVAALIALPLAWLTTGFEVARWIPRRQGAAMIDPSDLAVDQVVRPVAGILLSLRSTVIAAANAAVGRELRAELHQRVARTSANPRVTGP